MMLGRKSAINDVRDALFSDVLEPLMKQILPNGLTRETFDISIVENEVRFPPQSTSIRKRTFRDREFNV